MTGNNSARGHSSSGIGKEFARQIAASGINIVLVARREPLLQEVGAELKKAYGVAYRVIPIDPHLGYGSRSLYATFYQDSVENIKSWIWRQSPGSANVS